MDELLYLVSKLSKKLDNVDDIIESDEEIIKITKIYDRLYDFLKESHAITTEEHKYRYNFVLSRYQFEKDYTNYEIFKSLLKTGIIFIIMHSGRWDDALFFQCLCCRLL